MLNVSVYEHIQEYVREKGDDANIWVAIGILATAIDEMNDRKDA